MTNIASSRLMLTPAALIAITLSLLCSNQSFAQEPQPTASSKTEWVKQLDDRAQRGTLASQRQNVRGDTGKWRDDPKLQHAPPIEQKPQRMALDDWADQLAENKVQLTANDDNWLLLRTVQLDDNDRVWVERIERHGNEFTVTAHQATWQGNYRKNFTYHMLLGVNLGKLEPGEYKATWVLKPLEFNRFEEPGTPRDNWPRDERESDAEPTELRVTFEVTAAES